MFTDVKKIKTFVAIVEEGSFTGAADRLNMAQPWVSVQLKQLEEMLDLTLVERSKGKLVKLSPNGREFFPIAKKLLASCAEATEEIRALRNRDRGKLVLGKDVRQVLAYVETGNADAGLVYSTDALVSGHVRVVETAPESAHDPIVYPAAVLAGSKNAEAARAFLVALTGPDARDVFVRRGFRMAH